MWKDDSFGFHRSRGFQNTRDDTLLAFHIALMIGAVVWGAPVSQRLRGKRSPKRSGENAVSKCPKKDKPTGEKVGTLKKSPISAMQIINGRGKVVVPWWQDNIKTAKC